MWNAIDTFFEFGSSNERMLSHQFDSFDDFVERQIALIMTRKQTITVSREIKDDPVLKRIRCELVLDEPQFGLPVFIDTNGQQRSLFPYEARMRNLSYTFPMSVRVRYNIIHMGHAGPLKQEQHESRRHFTQIPCMVRSTFCSLSTLKPEEFPDYGECTYDDGGYFLINGNEKVVIAQEKMGENRLFIFDQKNQTKFSHAVEIRSIDKSTLLVNTMHLRLLSQEQKARQTTHKPQRRQAVIGSRKSGIRSLGGQIVVKVSHVKKDIPLFILFRALAQADTTDQELMSYIMGSSPPDRVREYLSLLQPSIEDAIHSFDGPCTRQACMLYILDKFTVKLVRDDPVQYVDDFLEKKVFPQYGANRKMKMFYLGYATRQLLDAYLGYRRYSDRDHYGNKRIEHTGLLMTQLFSQIYDRYVKDLKLAIHKELNSQSEIQIYKLVKNSLIEKSLKYALCTGNWNMKRANTQTEKRKGVSQVLSRMTYIATLSHLRRINTPMENKSGKLIRPRQLHSSHLGYICPAETPEGQPVGLVKNLTLMDTLTVGSPSILVRMRLPDWIEPLPEWGSSSWREDDVLLFLNGKFVGRLPNMDKGVELRDWFRAQRRQGMVPYDASIVMDFDRSEIMMYTDPGRSIRPVWIVHKTPSGDCLPWELEDQKDTVDKLRRRELHWHDLLKSQWIEYVDAEESENLLIARSVSFFASHRQEKWTHCEIHPITLLGPVAGMIPFPEHNQSPRNAYQAAMGKQCISQYVLNPHQRMDTVANILLHPERPLVSTRIAEYMHANELPYGQHMRVAFLLYNGYNEEDACILNRQMCERSQHNAVSHKTYKAEERKHPSHSDEKICRPDQYECKGRRFGSYDKLDDRGIIKEGSYVDTNDVIVGKVTISKGKNAIYRDTSLTVKPSDAGIADKVFQSVNADGHMSVKVRIEAARQPVIGDKFAARPGQKATVGMFLDQHMMPFTQDGVPLGMLINPHCIPSRMTIGLLLEILIGRCSSATGRFYDATAFENDMPSLMKVYSDIMVENGMHPHGKEKLIDPVSGQLMDALVFSGEMFTQRLRHMVEDKIHSRARGPVAPLTRQPCEGRSRLGGLRLGEMERDCLLAHGAPNFLNERLSHCSDGFSAYVCDLCGLIAPFSDEPTTPDIEIKRCCKPCGNFTRFSKISIPYASKLLFQELMSMGIVGKVHT